MNYAEYLEMMNTVPDTEGIEYRPAYVWPTANVPLAAVSLPGTEASVVRIPEKLSNRYGRMVPVVTIAGRLFRGNKKVRDIILPSGIGNLPDGAFAGCTALERITIPKRVSYIGPGTFDRCGALTDIYYEGSAEEWDQIRIVHCRHEIEFGGLVPGTPVQRITAERRIYIPGNEALFTANIHFHCSLGEPEPGVFQITAGGKDVTDIFRTCEERT